MNRWFINKRYNRVSTVLYQQVQGVEIYYQLQGVEVVEQVQGLHNDWVQGVEVVEQNRGLHNDQLQGIEVYEQVQGVEVGEQVLAFTSIRAIMFLPTILLLPNPLPPPPLEEMLQASPS